MVVVVAWLSRRSSLGCEVADSRGTPNLLPPLLLWCTGYGLGLELGPRAAPVDMIYDM
jgi:hypothetical protein